MIPVQIVYHIPLTHSDFRPAVNVILRHRRYRDWTDLLDRVITDIVRGRDLEVIRLAWTAHQLEGGLQGVGDQGLPDAECSFSVANVVSLYPGQVI